MTHYWWMHWFWITYSTAFIFLLIFCETAFGLTVPVIHSSINETALLVNNSNSSRNGKAIYRNEEFVNPPNNQTVSLNFTFSPNKTNQSVENVNQKARNKTSTHLNAKNQKINLKYLSKKDFIFLNASKSNLTAFKQENATKSTVILKSIIDSANSTNTTIDSPSISSNLTLDDNATEDSSLLLNSERIGSDLEQADDGNADSSSPLSAAGITGITLACVVVVGAICAVSYVLYRNRGFNRPQVLNDRCSNPDSSGYIDDASVRDNSEEMYSLDNDSFLNSLEAMTIQNYWTDTVKHTKL